MQKAPMSCFGISATGISKDMGSLSSTTSRNSETQNVKSAQESLRHFSYQDFKRHGASLYVFSLGHPQWKKQLMNIEMVVETSTQLINGGHGKG
jgi:hypothetical protein